ncbi:hypothetical protein [Duganella violaceipulchra]|uniref:Uncharacterized protein n=1 Tax=Duganella violaceipulchra TaxID=2849652 RepID=A0AA41H4H5_9BURK|nr:hypothetical protein [Duganella violaceicalia]MBV6319499.1 hypothetical protein [Duganella violaceicalia]MCP2006690.1 hypothetical protein [Duganella violaceicalia]
MNLSLSKTREVFSLRDVPGNCSRPMMEFFVVGDRILVPAGVYISIVDGKVVDQIQGCDMSLDYVCMLEGTPKVRLTESGKFKPL